MHSYQEMSFVEEVRSHMSDFNQMYLRVETVISVFVILHLKINLIPLVEKKYS